MHPLLFTARKQMNHLATDSLYLEWNNWTHFLDDTTSGLVLAGISESHLIERIFLCDALLAKLLKLEHLQAHLPLC